MKEITIYLAGKMSGLSHNQMNTWRLETENLLRNYSSVTNSTVNIINPVSYYNFEEKRYKSEREVMQFDINKVRGSDIIIVNMEGLNSSIGTCIECYEAYKREIPVLAFGSQELFNEVHSWVQCCITRKDDNYIETCKYIKDFYMV